jgi:hypothetical protein
LIVKPILTPRERENGVSVQIGDNICIPPIDLNHIGSTPLPSGRQSTAVATLGTPYADPDTEELRLKLNELLTTLRR